MKACFFVAVIFLGFSAQVLASQKSDLKTVEFVDLKRYQGQWFEVASIPASFQRKCLGNVTAEYSLLDSGEVKVVNSCDEKEERNVAVARARVKDTQTNAKLDVAFFKFLGHYVFLFAGDYWIIDLDPNYQWAVVGSPNRKFAWILARTPALDGQTLSGIAERLQKQKYNPCQLKTTKQNGGFTERKSLCDIL